MAGHPTGGPTVSANLGYVWEKLRLAVLGLARSNWPLPARLGAVYLAHLRLLDPEDVPEDVRQDLAQIRTTFSTLTEFDEGVIRAATARLGEETARDLIEKVVGIYDRVCRRLGGDG
jgi:hypothetical protein